MIGGSTLFSFSLQDCSWLSPKRMRRNRRNCQLRLGLADRARGRGIAAGRYYNSPIAKLFRSFVSNHKKSAKLRLTVSGFVSIPSKRCGENRLEFPAGTKFVPSRAVGHIPAFDRNGEVDPGKIEPICRGLRGLAPTHTLRSLPTRSPRLVTCAVGRRCHVLPASVRGQGDTDLPRGP